MDKDVAREALEEARRRYDEQGAIHDKAHEQITIWLSVAALVLGAMMMLVPATFRSLPTTPPACLRLLGMIVCAVTFVVAAFFLRRFFFGREMTQIGNPEEWLGYAKGLQGENAEVALMQELAGFYAEAATKRQLENKQYLQDQLVAKTWIAFASIAAVVTGFVHLAESPP